MQCEAGGAEVEEWLGTNNARSHPTRLRAFVVVGGKVNPWHRSILTANQRYRSVRAKTEMVLEFLQAGMKQILSRTGWRALDPRRSWSTIDKPCLWFISEQKNVKDSKKLYEIVMKTHEQTV